jgi:hypothetical protein
MSTPPQSPASKLAEKLLVGTVEAIARAGAKAVESLAGDMKKALKNEAFKAEVIEKGVEAWRKERLGDIDDLPESLRDESPATPPVSNGTTEENRP